jgi:hypothetical protein
MVAVSQVLRNHQGTDAPKEDRGVIQNVIVTYIQR